MFPQEESDQGLQCYQDQSDKRLQFDEGQQCLPKSDGWMDDLRFSVLFNSMSVISGRCLDDNERLCAMKFRLRLRRFHLE